LVKEAREFIEPAVAVAPKLVSISLPSSFAL